MMSGDRIAEIRGQVDHGFMNDWDDDPIEVARALLAELDRVTRERDEAVQQRDVHIVAHELMTRQFRTMQLEKEHGWRESERAESKLEAAEAALQQVRALADHFRSLGRAPFGADEVASRIDAALSGPAGTPEPVVHNHTHIQLEDGTEVPRWAVSGGTAQQGLAVGQHVELRVGLRVEMQDFGRWIPCTITNIANDRVYLEGPAVPGDSRSLHWEVMLSAADGLIRVPEDKAQTDEEFFRAGYAAFGVGTLKNPYRVGTSEWQAWNEGWFKAAEVAAPETSSGVGSPEQPAADEAWEELRRVLAGTTPADRQYTTLWHAAAAVYKQVRDGASPVPVQPQTEEQSK